jgi:hypothetical protein
MRAVACSLSGLLVVGSSYRADADVRFLAESQRTYQYALRVGGETASDSR